MGKLCESMAAFPSVTLKPGQWKVFSVTTPTTGLPLLSPGILSNFDIRKNKKRRKKNAL